MTTSKELIEQINQALEYAEKDLESFIVKSPPIDTPPPNSSNPIILKANVINYLRSIQVLVGGNPDKPKEESLQSLIHDKNEEIKMLHGLIVEMVASGKQLERSINETFHPDLKTESMKQVNRGLQ